jgi:transposase
MQDTPRRPRRRHSATMKAEILDACAEPGASVAGVALSYGVNANLVHRWRREAKRPLSLQPVRRGTAEFVALPVAAAATERSAAEIRIELRRGACAVTVAWPTSAAAECAVWLRDLVR